MRRAVYPGSFDPVTFGHLDIIRRSAVLVDELIVGVLTNSAKTPLFSAEERVNILADVTKDIGNVTIKAFDGLSVDFARNCGAQFMMSCKEILTWISMYICCEILLSQEKNTSDAVKRCWPMRQLQNTSL